MSKSTDDTNELESYGVWVKHPADGAEESSIENLNSDETEELELPDFDDTDFSDMFKDDSEFSTETESNDFIDDDNTTLSVDELANITSTAETVEEDELDITDSDFSFEEEAANTEEPVVDDLSIDDTFGEELSIEEPAADAELSVEETFDFDAIDSAVEESETSDDMFDISFDEVGEEAPVEESISEEPVVEETTDSFDTEEFTFEDITDESSSVETVEETASGEEEVSLDDFGFDIEETTEEEAPVSVTSDSGDEEISLDDFMDEGFSDESVASGNNGFAADAIPTSSDSEEISLDDFGFSDDDTSAAPQEAIVEETTDETPLEMDLNFDDSVDTIETEENISVDSDDFDFDSDDSNTDENTEVGESKEEEVSLDEFTSDSSSFDTESVDLSDFGIDSDAEETPVTQDVSSEKLKETKIDYDLSVGNANSAAPVVTEIATPEEGSEIIEEVEEPVAAAQPAATNDSTSISNALLQQIVNDLSGLKNEINQLKSNLEEMKTNGITSEPVIIEETGEKEESGFFSGDDGDDTIALSFDELDNIMNNAEINAVEAEVIEETAEEPVIDDQLFVEPETEETSVDIPGDDLPESVDFNFDDSTAIENFSANDTTIDLEAEDLPSEISIPKYEDEADTEEPVIAETVTEEPVIEDTIEEDISVEPVIEDTISEEPVIEDTEDSFDSIFVSAEGADEEPNFDIGEELSNDSVEEIVVEEASEEPLIEEELTTDDLEEAVSEEPLVDEPLIEETIDEAEIVEVEESDDSVESIFVSAEGADEEPNFDIGEELSNDTVEDFTVEEVSEEPVIEETVEAVSADDLIDEPVADDTLVEEPVVDEVVSEEPVIEESVIEESEDFNSVDNIFDSIEVETTENEEPEIVETSVEPVIEEAEDFDPFVSTASSDVTESDINSLTEDTAKEEKTPNDELKQDIKSVLLYMDQLLENLPEEKIIEFAKSDEFSTYKKLFSELGLS